MNIFNNPFQVTTAQGDPVDQHHLPHNHEYQRQHEYREEPVNIKHRVAKRKITLFASVENKVSHLLSTNPNGEDKEYVGLHQPHHPCGTYRWVIGLRNGFEF